MRTMAMLLAGAVAVGGCADPPAAGVGAVRPAAAAAAPALAGLEGTQWRFVQAGGTPVPATLDAILRFRAGRASGRAGCNTFASEMQTTAEGDTTFVRLMATHMACLQPAGAMVVERAVFDALRSTRRVSVGAGRLVLEDGAGRPLAVLVPARAK